MEIILSKDYRSFIKIFMEIILSKDCRSFTGTISRSHGYCIRRVGNRFFSKRNTNAPVTPDGHWRFILSIAHLAPSNLVVADIRIRGTEILDALYEAGYPFAVFDIVKARAVYCATDVLKLEKRLTEFLSAK